MQWAEAHVLLIYLALDKIDQLADSGDLFLDLQLDAELLLEVHDHLDGVERIDAEALERGVAGDLILRNIQLRRQIRTNLLKHDNSLRENGDLS